MDSTDKLNTVFGATGNQGGSVARSLLQAGVQHLVFSFGSPCTEMTKGKVQMKAMNMKYRIEQYAKQLGSFQTVIPIGAGWFLENFLDKEVAPIFGGFPYFADDDGYLIFRVPYWFGDIVQGIFIDLERWDGHFVHGVSDSGSFQYLVDGFQAATGHKARFQSILPSWKAFDTRGVRELEDVKLMFGFAQETAGRYFGPESTERETARELKRATAVVLGRASDQQDFISVQAWFESWTGK